jgi:2-amino-4-hydroxy-6-hydroxymethyldihydropteridine diphosphokinase
MQTPVSSGYELVCIALGCNLGARMECLNQGIEFLKSLSHNGFIQESPRFETDPVDCPPGSEPFLNSVALIHVDCDLWPPRVLLDALQKFEQDLGRPVIREQNAPRPIDLDIIFYGSLIVTEPTLLIPHPRATERRFVLEPLSKLLPDLVLPGQSKTVLELLDGLD